MKLHNKEIQKRLTVKLDKTINDDKSSGIMRFGEDNDYPQVIEKLILGSETGVACAKIYAKFIGGESFTNPEIGKIVVGKDQKGKPITLDKIRREIAKSISFYNGVYIHTNLNIGGEVTDTKIVPFKNCRFSMEDDLGYCSRIATNKDWTNRRNKVNVSWFNTFNTNEEVLRKEIEDAGSIEKYKGQIYFSFIDDNYLYPLSPFDSIYLNLDTEYQIQLFKNREIRNGFSDKMIMMLSMSEDEHEEGEIYEEIEKFMGADSDKTLVFNTEFDEQGNIVDKNFKIEKLENNINDNLFESWEKSISNSIRKSINGLPATLIDYESSQLGSASGEAIIQMTHYYNSLTQDIRTHIAEIIKEVYSNSSNEKLKNNTDWNITPVSIIDKNDTNV